MKITPSVRSVSKVPDRKRKSPKNLWLYPVHLLANSMQVFYVTLSERKLLYLTGSGSGAALCSSEDLLIMEGTGFSDVGV